LTRGKAYLMGVAGRQKFNEGIKMTKRKKSKKKNGDALLDEENMLDTFNSNITFGYHILLFHI